MRIGAIILNVMLLVASPIFVADWGKLPSPDDGWIFIYFLLVIVVPVFTLLALFLANFDSWLCLYFKRKAAEERQRIHQIQSQGSSRPEN